MTVINLDDNERFLEVGYTGTDDKHYVLKVDCVEAHDFLGTLGDKFPTDWDAQQDAMREWAEDNGAKAMPASYLLLLGGAIRHGYEEFKKKADKSLTSQIFSEPESSILDQLKSGHLKLAPQEPSPAENSETDGPQENSPQTASSA